MLSTTTRKYGTLLSTAAVALAVLLLAWPQFMASVRYLPIEHALERYYRDRQIPTDRLPVLIRFANEAILQQDHHRFYDGLSLLHLLRAMDVNTPALQRIGEYRSAESAAVATLARAPAQPAAWLRIANVRWILHDEPEDVITPWKMSIFTGRTDSSLLLPRIEIGLAHRFYMDEEGTAMLRDQLELAWRMHPGSLMNVLRLRDPDLVATRSLIGSTDPVAFAEIEAWLERLR